MWLYNTWYFCYFGGKNLPYQLIMGSSLTAAVNRQAVQISCAGSAMHLPCAVVCPTPGLTQRTIASSMLHIPTKLSWLSQQQPSGLKAKRSPILSPPPNATTLPWQQLHHFLRADHTPAVFPAGMVCVWPFINLLYRSNGLTDAQIGILAALKPWTSAPSSFLWSGLADRLSAHKAIMLATFVTSTLTRVGVSLAHSFWAFLVLAVAGEFLAAPVGVMADAAVVAACKRVSSHFRDGNEREKQHLHQHTYTMIALLRSSSSCYVVLCDVTLRQPVCEHMYDKRCPASAGVALLLAGH
jgi:hypothetical protein